MNLYEAIVTHFKTKKINNALNKDDLIIIKILFESIQKERLDMKHLNNVSCSASTLIKVLYGVIAMSLKDEQSKLIKTIMPITMREALEHTKKIHYFVHNNCDYQAFLDFTPNEDDFHSRNLKMEDVICYFKKRAIHNKIIMTGDEIDVCSKREKVKTIKRYSPYMRIVSVPFGGQNKKY